MDRENCTKNSENFSQEKPANKDDFNFNFHADANPILVTNKLNHIEQAVDRLIDEHNCSLGIDMEGNTLLNINDGKLYQNMNVNGAEIGVTAPDVLNPYFVTAKHTPTKLPVKLDTSNEFRISRKRSIQALCLEIIPRKHKRYIHDASSLNNNCEKMSKGDAVLNLAKNMNQFNISDSEVTIVNSETENLENRLLNPASIGRNLYMHKRKKIDMKNDSLEKTLDKNQQDVTHLPKGVLRFGLSRKIKVKPLHPQLHNIMQ